MEDRYEIREKIGQGGLGAVYRGFDSRMNREVAIKRIGYEESDKDLLEESTRQLVKEAAALASLQHPHIVTIYDVGTDAEGPYVVMELITGKTLDELIEHAPLTWDDFRELAVQTQEALIAAQELDLIHRDIKPSNIMLAWLPSGKFQIKVVDFGLAQLAAQPDATLPTDADSVFGSIHFMAPEQFERKEPDVRTDMYAMGCVYYYALTGNYPFEGETGPEVMAAHLNHQIIPLQEARSELPSWVCDWVMWHLNRSPDDRPANSREALQVFFQNDKAPPAETPPPAEPAKRSRLIIPGVSAEPPPPAPAPPPPSEPQVVPAAPTPELIAEPKRTTSSVKTQAPQPLTPPEGSKPSVYTSSVPLPPADEPVPEPKPVSTAQGPQLVATGQATGTGQSTLSRTIGQPAKASPNHVARITITIILALLCVFLGYYILKRKGENRQAQIFNEIIHHAAPADVTEIPINRAQLELLLKSATDVGTQNSKQRLTVYKALRIARPSDGTDIDARIAEFVTQEAMIEDVRTALFRDVIRHRAGASSVPILLQFAETTSNTIAAAAALEAVAPAAPEAVFPQILEIITTTPHDAVRRAAESVAVAILKKTSRPAPLGKAIGTAYAAAGTDAVRHSLIRLLGRVGGSQELKLIAEILESEELTDRIAALTALSQWPNEDGFEVLLTTVKRSNDDPSLRARAFEMTLRFLANQYERDPQHAQTMWTALASEATTKQEHLSFIRALYQLAPDDWVMAILKQYIDTSDDDSIILMAERAHDSMSDRLRLQQESEGPAKDEHE